MSTGLRRMLGVLWCTQRRAVLVWILALAASLVATAAAIAGLYDTPEKIHTYAAAVTSGEALVAINGTVEGVDSLGGVIQNEFGFLAAFLVPLLGISLITRSTRREEEAGRLETVLAGQVARHTPTLAALLLATTAILVTSVAFAVGLAAFGVPFGGAVLYAASLGALGLAFAGMAAVLAQFVPHARGVYTGGLLILAAAYVIRGVGDVTGTWLTWLSPLGWAEKAAAFGPARWWTLVIPVVVALALAGLAIMLATRRDLGSALARGGAGPARATSTMRSPAGLAWRIHRSAILGWLAGSLLLAAMMGMVAQQYIDAILGNKAMAQALGASLTRPVDSFVAVTVLYLAIIASGYAVQALGALRAEEAEGRLETRLAGTLSRRRWLAAHGLVILAGLVLIVVAGSVVFALATAWSTGDGSRVAPILRAGLAYLPAELVLATVTLLIFGGRPRLLPVAWAAFAFVAFLAFLGPGLQLPGWVLDLAPTTHIGLPPLDPIQTVGVAALAVLAVLLTAGGFARFHRRDIPQA